MTFLYDIRSLCIITIKCHYIQIDHSSEFGKNRNILNCKYVNIMLNVDVNILIDIKGFMTSKVEGLEKLKRFHFKLKERLDLKLSYSVLHSLLNDCKNKIGGNNGKLKKVHL